MAGGKYFNWGLRMTFEPKLEKPKRTTRVKILDLIDLLDNEACFLIETSKKKFRQTKLHPFVKENN